MSSPTSGALVRRSDSVHPVHSWKCSQMIEGRDPDAAFSAIFSPAHAGSPTAPAASVQTLRKLRRETPPGVTCSTMLSGAVESSMWSLREVRQRRRSHPEMQENDATDCPLCAAAHAEVATLDCS